MNRKTYYEALFHKLNGRRESEYQLFTNLAREISEISRRMQALRIYLENTDHQVLECAEMLGEPSDEAE